jgi:hypothetical protein
MNNKIGLGSEDLQSEFQPQALQKLIGTLDPIRPKLLLVCVWSRAWLDDYCSAETGKVRDRYIEQLGVQHVMCIAFGT